MILVSIEIIKDKLKELNQKDTLEAYEILLASQLGRELVILEKLADSLVDFDITGKFNEFKERMSDKEIYILTKGQNENLIRNAKKYNKIKEVVDGE